MEITENKTNEQNDRPTDDKQDKPLVTRAEKANRMKTILRDLLKERTYKWNELLDAAAKVYVDRFPAENSDSNDLKGRMGSALSLMEDDGEMRFESGVCSMIEKTAKSETNSDKAAKSDKSGKTEKTVEESASAKSVKPAKTAKTAKSVKTEKPAKAASLKENKEKPTQGDKKSVLHKRAEKSKTEAAPAEVKNAEVAPAAVQTAEVKNAAVKNAEVAPVKAQSAAMKTAETAPLEQKKTESATKKRGRKPANKSEEKPQSATVTEKATMETSAPANKDEKAKESAKQAAEAKPAEIKSAAMKTTEKAPVEQKKTESATKKRGRKPAHKSEENAQREAVAENAPEQKNVEVKSEEKPKESLQQPAKEKADELAPAKEKIAEEKPAQTEKDAPVFDVIDLWNSLPKKTNEPPKAASNAKKTEKEKAESAPVFDLTAIFGAKKTVAPASEKKAEKQPAPLSSSAPARNFRDVEKQAEKRFVREEKPAEVKPVEVKPADTKPAEVKPVEVKPAAVKPAEVKPAETKPAEVKRSEPVQPAQSTLKKQAIDSVHSVVAQAAKPQEKKAALTEFAFLGNNGSAKAVAAPSVSSPIKNRAGNSAAVSSSVSSPENAREGVRTPTEISRERAVPRGQGSVETTFSPVRSAVPAPAPVPVSVNNGSNANNGNNNGNNNGGRRGYRGRGGRSMRETVAETPEDAVKSEFLKLLRSLGGDYFEYYSVYLLERYSLRNGRRLEGLRISGGERDGGIDGEIELTDKFGFRETIYIQSKNWDPSKGDIDKWIVGETLLQQFIGAVACRQAKENKQHSRGIFITTSHFTPEGKELLASMSDRFVGYDCDDIFEAAKECSFGMKKTDGVWAVDTELLSGDKAFFDIL